MYEDDDFFNGKYEISVNSPESGYFLHLDSNIRPRKASMEFQHSHSFYEAYILLDHSAGYFIEGRYYALYEGDIVLIKPGIMHKCAYFDDFVVRRIYIAFSPDWFTSLCPEAERSILAPFDAEVPVYRFDHETVKRLVDILRDAFHEDVRFGAASRPFTVSAAGIFLYRLAETIREKENVYTNKEFDSITHKIYSISSYISDHYGEPLSLNSLASRFFISSCYLSRMFKEVSGCSLVHYIQQVRVVKAKEMLASTNEQILSISEKCGFTSFSQFSRIFRSYTGMTPRRYREERGAGGRETII